MRALVKTQTAGWFQLVQDTGEVATQKVRKADGDEIYASVQEAQQALQVLQVLAKSRNGNEPEPREAPKPDVPVTVAPTGKVLVGKTITITCTQDGCSGTRVIKPQDAFQVKFCVPHQEEHRKEVRRAKQKAKTAARRTERQLAKQ